MPLELSIVVPAYNESKRIGRSLIQIKQFCQRHIPTYEVIVVDDGSQDGTSRVIKSQFPNWPELVLLSEKKNQGKGHAIRAGIFHAQGNWILTIDADLPIPIEQILKFLQLKENFSIVIASRYCHGSAALRPQPFHRRIMGYVFSSAVRSIVFGDFLDTQCGVKLYRREVAKNLFGRLTVNRFAFDVEILFLAKRLGYEVCEVPIVWQNDPRTTVSLIKDPYKMFMDLIKIRKKYKHEQ